MSDKRTQAGEITGVFEVIREIEEIGARVGDRLVLASHEAWPVALVRRLDDNGASWAFRREYATLKLTYPPMMNGLALRLLQEGMKSAVDGHGPALGSHLTLVP